MENQAKQYLQSFSKDELIRLIMKYAPEQLFIEVNNKHVNSSTALTVFKIVNQNIQKVLKDADLLNNPRDFDTALTKQISKLVGLEKHLKIELEGLIFDIIINIDNAFDDGYLNDYDNDVDYEPSDEFVEVVTNFVKDLDYNEKIVFILKLYTILEEQSNTTFQCLYNLPEEIFTDADLPSLKNMLMSDYQNLSNNLIEKYYDQVREMLSLNEKETILKIIKFNSTYKFIELVKLYESKNELQKAIDVIKIWLERVNKSYGDEMVYSLYLDLLKKTQQSISEVAKEALTLCPKSSMLQKIASLDSSNISEYELILEKKNPGQLLEYLEKENRLPETLALIKRNNQIADAQLFIFFKTHKEDFPTDAEKYFIGVIDKNLENAGDVYYHAIADALDHLNHINQTLANEYIKNIRFNYKRRRNLIAILSKF